MARALRLAFKESKNRLVPQGVEIEQKIIALQMSKADRLEPPFALSNASRFL